MNNEEKDETIYTRENLPSVGKFEKVSFAQYHKDFGFEAAENYTFERWEKIKLPERATAGSKGYDFYCPRDIVIPGDGGAVTIETGIRARMDHGCVLCIVPRSGLGFKYGLRLANTIGVIDEDYYYSDNEGHIMIRMQKNPDGKPLVIRAGERFAQGLFLLIGVTIDDNATAVRNGGIGSTGLK